MATELSHVCHMYVTCMSHVCNMYGVRVTPAIRRSLAAYNSTCVHPYVCLSSRNYMCVCVCVVCVCVVCVCVCHLAWDDRKPFHGACSCYRSPAPAAPSPYYLLDYTERGSRGLRRLRDLDQNRLPRHKLDRFHAHDESPAQHQELMRG